MEPAADWSNFLMAAAAAVGALVGLVFVALSINLARIIQLPGVSGRAAETIFILAGALVETLVALVPGQTAPRLGATLLPVAVAAWGIPVGLQLQALRRRHFYRPSFALMRVAFHQAATLPAILAGLSFCGLLAGGMYWLAAGVVLSLVFALVNAWILLVEIIR